MKKFLYRFIVLIASIVFIANLSAEKSAPGEHKVVFQISQNNPETMNLLLNNISNLENAYYQKGEDLMIEIVAYGPGLAMMRDISPVKERIKIISENYDNVSFLACEKSIKAAEKKEKKKIKLLPQVKTVPGGVMHIIQRQEEGWSYIKP